MNSLNGGGKASSDTGIATNADEIRSVNEKYIDEAGNGNGSAEVIRLDHDMAVTHKDLPQESNWDVLLKNSLNGGGKASSDTSTATNADEIRSVNEKNIDESGNGNGSPEVIRLDHEMAVTPKDLPQESNWDVLLKKSVTSGPKSWGCLATAPESSIHVEGSFGGYDAESDKIPYQSEDGSDDDESFTDLEDDVSDHYESDVSQKSNETRKRNRWFRSFFEAMDRLTATEIKGETRRWHCPACHDGPGAIGWYRGLQPLMTHAKTKRSSRVKLHREFAELLELEIRRRGLDVDVLNRWNGVHESITDTEIVWPPMVVVLNTLVKKADTDECLRISSKELCEFFKEYAVVKARSSNCSNGHQGMSVLIFEASAMGYWEAENLHKHFMATGRDREAWERCPLKLSPCTGLQFYGFLAQKQDIDILNQLSEEKHHLKFEMKSYREMVMIPMRQMSKDIRTLVWFKNKDLQQQKHIKSLEESLRVASQNLPQKAAEDTVSRMMTEIKLDDYNGQDCDKGKLSNEDSGTDDDSSISTKESSEEEKKRLLHTFL